MNRGLAALETVMLALIRMKDVKLLDAMPTAFGFFMLTGLLFVVFFNPNTDAGPLGTLGPMMLYGGGLVLLVTALLSVALTKPPRALRGVYLLNLSWLVLVALLFASAILVATTFRIG